MITLIYADSLACVCGVVGLDVPEQNKGDLKLLLKYILRQFNPEDIEGSDDGGSDQYLKLHNYPRVSFSKNFMHLLVPKKNLNSLKSGLIDSSQLFQNFIWKN